MVSGKYSFWLGHDMNFMHKEFCTFKLLTKWILDPLKRCINYKLYRINVRHMRVDSKEKQGYSQKIEVKTLVKQECFTHSSSVLFSVPL